MTRNSYNVKESLYRTIPVAKVGSSFKHVPEKKGTWNEFSESLLIKTKNLFLSTYSIHSIFIVFYFCHVHSVPQKTKKPTLIPLTINA